MGGHANGNMFGKRINQEAAIGGHANSTTSVGTALQSGVVGRSTAGWSTCMGKLGGAISATNRIENYKKGPTKRRVVKCAVRESRQVESQ